jgi:uncharacterized protein (TIGR04255 family)
MTLFGRLYELIQEEFPKKRQQIHVQTTLPLGAGDAPTQEIDPRMIFERDDGTALVQLAPHRLVVNKLPPYGNWQSLKSLILARLDDYDHLADAQPLYN